MTGSIVNWNFFNVPYPYGGNMSAQQFNLPISTYYPLFNASDTVSWQHGAHTFNFGFSFYREQDHYWNAPAGIPSFNLGLATGDPAINAFTSSPSLATAPSAALSEAEQLYAILTGRISSVAGQFAYDHEDRPISERHRRIQSRRTFEGLGLVLPGLLPNQADLDVQLRFALGLHGRQS